MKAEYNSKDHILSVFLEPQDDFDEGENSSISADLDLGNGEEDNFKLVYDKEDDYTY